MLNLQLCILLISALEPAKYYLQNIVVSVVTNNVSFLNISFYTIVFINVQHIYVYNTYTNFMKEISLK